MAGSRKHAIVLGGSMAGLATASTGCRRGTNNIENQQTKIPYRRKTSFLEQRTLLRSIRNEIFSAVDVSEGTWPRSAMLHLLV